MTLNLTLTALDTPDLPGIRAVLRRHGMSSDGGIHLTNPNLGSASFETSYLGEEATSFYGQIFGADPANEALLALVFELSTAGPLLLTVDPGPPHIAVCGHAFDVEDVTDESVPPWLEVVVVVDTPAELGEVLRGGWRDYRSTFADRYWDLPSSFS